MENIKNKKLQKTLGLLTILGLIVGIISGVYPFYQNWKTKDFSGRWKITCNIQNSSLQRYIGKSTGWKMFFIQDNDKVSGKGEMYWVDNKEIPYSQHVRIEMEGKIEENDVALTYTQYGEKRTTYGEIKLKINREIAEGNFSGTAANTNGIVKAEKLKE